MVSSEGKTPDRLRYRAPLLWIGIPLCVGYSLATAFPINPVWLACVGGLLAVFAYGIRKRSFLLWASLFLTATLLLAWSWYEVRRPDFPPHWETWPVREAELQLKVERLFDTPYAQVAGIGKVVAASLHLAHIQGHSFYFSLKAEDVQQPFIRSTVLNVRGLLDPLSDAEEGSFEAFLIQNGINFRLTRGQILGVAEAAHPFQVFCHVQRQRLEQFLREGTSDKTHALTDIYVAMLLGVKSVLSPSQKDAFIASGTLHLFAISGLHIGVWALTLSYLLKILRLPRPAAALIGLIALFFYVHITGASPSAVRAFLMIAFFGGARAFLRQSAALSAWAASAVAVLVYDPLQLWQAGFQLSYAVVAAILLYGIPLGQKLQEVPWFSSERPEPQPMRSRLLRKGLQGLALLFGISLAATLMSSPLSIAYFHVFSPGGILLNIALVSLAALTVISGVLALIFSLLYLPGLGIFINHGAWTLLWVLEEMVQIALTVPGFFWHCRFVHSLVAPAVVILLLAVLIFGYHLKGGRSLFYSVPLIIWGLSLTFFLDW